VTRDMVSVDLKLALRQPGCPICRLRAESELRYIRSLLWESVTDPLTRGHFIASLGYCPEHTWQTGLVEKESFGSALGNAILYEHLSGVIQGRLTAYARRVRWARQAWWQRWLHALWPWSSQHLTAHELQPEAQCRVCQMGEQSEQTHLVWLLRGLSGSKNDFPEWYTASDGLCLPHLRQGLAVADRNAESGARFLVETTLQRLKTLQHDLSEFERKNSWNYRHEEKTEAENSAWWRALTFFGGNQEIDREPEVVSPLTD
jgi:hypothetical protein